MILLSPDRFCLLQEHTSCKIMRNGILLTEGSKEIDLRNVFERELRKIDDRISFHTRLEAFSRKCIEIRAELTVEFIEIRARQRNPYRCLMPAISGEKMLAVLDRFEEIDVPYAAS